MKTAVISDIHGNLRALEAVQAEIEGLGVDEIVVAGDVLPGPFPAETLDRILEVGRPIRFIHGNGDRNVLRALRGQDLAEISPAFHEWIRWNAAQLTSNHAETIAGWPSILTFESALGSVFVCHATPRNDTDVFFRRTSEEALLPLFEPVAEPIVVCGHTHLPFDRHVGRHRVLNSGSVGMPNAERGAFWLLFDEGVQFRRTDYDVEAAAAEIRRSGSPRADEIADGLLDPRSEDEMLSLFANIELR